MSALVVAGMSGVGVTINAEAYNRRQVAIENARDVVRINNALDATLAAESMRELSALSSTVEKSRVEVKKPVLEIGRTIDKAATDFVTPIHTERERLGALLTSYEMEKRRIAEEAERQRQAEERRRQEEERRRIAAAEAEARKAREAVEAAERAAMEADNAEQRRAHFEALRQAETARVEAEALRQKREAEAASRQAMAAVAIPERIAGTTLQQPWTFEVVDIRALYAACPDLCEVNARRSAVLALIRSGTREIPGLRIFQDARVTVR